MYPHFLALPLPATIRSRLSSFCYGLPQVRWVEEDNLHLTLRYFGPLTSSLLEEVQERLKPLFFYPFSITLKGMGHFHSRKSHGVIWIGIAENPFLSSLKKEIDVLLRGVELPPDDRPFHPHVTLGRYERLNIHKLTDYLAFHAEYQSEPILINTCLLMRSQHTPKRVFYEVVDQYTASVAETGED